MARFENGEHQSTLRLRQMCAAFLLGTIVIALFSLIGIRGTQQNETTNEQLLDAFKAGQDLLNAIHYLELQIVLVGVEYESTGYSSFSSLQRCRVMVELIDERYSALGLKAGAILGEDPIYYEFIPLLHQLALQVAILELDTSPDAIESTLQSSRHLYEIAATLSQRMEKEAAQNTRAGKNIGFLSLGLIAVSFALLLIFTLPILFVPPPGAQRRQRNKVYFLSSHPGFRREPPTE